MSPARAASGCLRLSLGRILMLIPFAIVLGFVIYGVVSTITSHGNSQQNCHTTSCSSNNDGGGGD
jgi:hypothetical protein